MALFLRTFILVCILMPLVVVLVLVSSIFLRPKPVSGSGLVTFWFDDAWASQYTSGVIQLMDKEGWVGAISVPTGLISTRNYMTWDQLRKLQAKGWETTSHSVTHICDPKKYDDKTTAYELLESKRALESRKFRADYFVIPCGYNSRILPNVVAFARKNYLAYRRAGEQINPLPVVDPYDLTTFTVTDMTSEEDVKKWVSEAVRKKGWLILEFHQIDGRKLRYNVSVEMFKKILVIVKDSKLPVVLPTQALQVKKN